MNANASVSFQNSREVPLALEKAVENELNSLLENDFIEPAPPGELQWCSPMVVVERKESSPEKKKVRICGNFRKVNQIMENDTQPIPTQKQIFAKLTNSCIFSKLDMRNGYHQVELEENSRKYTNFWTRKGIFRYKRLPFGTKPSPFIFARIVERIVGDIPGVVYFFDDILLHSPDEKKHYQLLNSVFTRLEDHGITLNLSKCQLGLKKVEYLGYQISEKGMEITDKYKSALINMERPGNKHELQKLMGCLVRVCPFIPKFTDVTAPLRRLLYEDSRYDWDEECEHAFSKLKEMLTDSPALSFIDSNLETILTVDSCKNGIGAFLSQVDQSGNEKLCAYGSRVLKSHEQHYSASEMEALGVIWSLSFFHYFFIRK